MATKIRIPGRKTNVSPMLWKRYIQLTDAEWAFRIAKDELEIRPISNVKSL